MTAILSFFYKISLTLQGAAKSSLLKFVAVFSGTV